MVEKTAVSSEYFTSPLPPFLEVGEKSSVPKVDPGKEPSFSAFPTQRDLRLLFESVVHEQANLLALRIQECFETKGEESSDLWIKRVDVLPIYSGKNPESGEFGIYVSTKEEIFSGYEKRIKRVVSISSQGEIKELVCLAPNKHKTVEGRQVQKTPEEIEESRREIRKEAEYIRALREEGVPNLLPTYTVPYVARDGTERKKVLQERYDEDLLEFLNRICDLEDQRPSAISCLLHVRAVLDTLCFLHEKEVTHRDIKPENILTKGDQTAFIDFEFARKPTEQLGGLYGSPGYIAPELFESVFGQKKCERDLFCIDMWAIGAVLLQIIYRGHSLIELQETIIKGLRACGGDTLSEQLENQIDRLLFPMCLESVIDNHSPCFNGNAEDIEKYRPIVKEILSQQDLIPKLVWLSTCVTQEIKRIWEVLKTRGDPLSLLICSLLSLNPAKRPTARKAHEELDTILHQLTR